MSIKTESREKLRKIRSNCTKLRSLMIYGEKKYDPELNHIYEAIEVLSKIDNKTIIKFIEQFNIIDEEFIKIATEYFKELPSNKMNEISLLYAFLKNLITPTKLDLDNIQFLDDRHFDDMIRIYQMNREIGKELIIILKNNLKTKNTTIAENCEDKINLHNSNDKIPKNIIIEISGCKYANNSQDYDNLELYKDNKGNSLLDKLYKICTETNDITTTLNSKDKKSNFEISNNKNYLDDKELY